MPLTSPAVPRKRIHTRSIRIEAFAREDGLWDVEAAMSDVKDVDLALVSGTRPAGEPIHAMKLTLTVDTGFNIKSASAQTLASPYGVHCAQAESAYEQLVGLNLMRGFRSAVKARLGGIQGCTHLTELTGVLPTAVLQSMVGPVIDPYQVVNGDTRPFELDSCQALRNDSPAVATYYPKWYRTEPTL